MKPDSHSPVISVIMPVYNTGRYLHESVNSVLAQDFASFELLLIDDGSTDGSSDVCDEYAVRDSRVRVIHGRNGGICASRNVGLELARGEWIAFCDHDDMVEPCWLSLMYNAGKEFDVDVIKCNHTWQDRSRGGDILTPPIAKNRETMIWERGDLRGESGYFLFMDLSSLVWNGLYRATFWRQLGLKFNQEFVNGCEDCYLGVDLLNSTARGVWIGDALYHHYFNYGLSTASRFHPEIPAMQLKTARHEKEMLGYSTPPELVAMFKRWSGLLRLFVYDVPECTWGLKKQSELLCAYYDEIVGFDTKYSMMELKSFGLRIMVFFMQRRWFMSWLIVLRLRRLFKRGWGRLVCWLAL